MLFCMWTSYLHLVNSSKLKNTYKYNYFNSLEAPGVFMQQLNSFVIPLSSVSYAGVLCNS